MTFPPSGRSRHGGLWGLTLLLVLCLGVGGAPHADEPPSAERVAEAAARGRAWLVAAQADDGSWGSAAFRGSVAVTSNAMMALIAGGSTPASGEHAAAVARGVDYCLACAGADGLIAGREQAAHGPMYGHAYATLVLAEVYGETDHDDQIAAVLARSHDLIVGTQNEDGGWRYQPRQADADVSVTAAMVIALRGLHNSGFAVSADCVDRAVAFLERLQNDDGGFRYLIAPGPAASPRTAAALVALLTADRAGPAADRGFVWLVDHPIALESGDGYAMYGLAHAASAHWLRGGASWKAWHAAVIGPLLDAQRHDGAWPDPSCPEYGTSAALTVLQVADGLSPLLQRTARDDEDPAE
ncbi:MAG: prenyltransferase/squalene oxidase repeat-containing protein [Planctomycetia bacterium]